MNLKCIRNFFRRKDKNYKSTIPDKPDISTYIKWRSTDYDFYDMDPSLIIILHIESANELRLDEDFNKFMAALSKHQLRFIPEYRKYDNIYETVVGISGLAIQIDNVLVSLNTTEYIDNPYLISILEQIKIEYSDFYFPTVQFVLKERFTAEMFPEAYQSGNFFKDVKEATEISSNIIPTSISDLNGPVTDGLISFDTAFKLLRIRAIMRLPIAHEIGLHVYRFSATCSTYNFTDKNSGKDFLLVDMPFDDFMCLIRKLAVAYSDGTYLIMRNSERYQSKLKIMVNGKKYNLIDVWLQKDPHPPEYYNSTYEDDDDARIVHEGDYSEVDEEVD